MKIRELLIDETRWIQNIYAINNDGKSCYVTSKDACKWCLDGALRRCYLLPQAKEIHKKLWDRIGNYVIWNDSPERTFAEVKALIEELDI